MRCVPLFLLLLMAHPSGAQQVLTFGSEPLTDELQLKFADTTGEVYLRKLRKDYRLDSLTQKDTTQMMKLLTICNWVRQQWEHNGDNIPQKWDPISILEEAATGKKFRCVEYSAVVAGCLNALGIPARKVELMTKDAETSTSGAAHVVTEAYITELQKWVMVDGQWNLVPFLNKTPLNAVELQKALAQKTKGLYFHSVAKTRADKKYRSWILPYLYYFSTYTDLRYFPEKFHFIKNKYQLMLAPVDVSCPALFQQKYPIEALCTHALNLFYQVPVKNQ